MQIIILHYADCTIPLSWRTCSLRSAFRTLLQDELNHDLNAAREDDLQANYKVGETVYATNAWERRTCELLDPGQGEASQ